MEAFKGDFTWVLEQYGRLTVDRAGYTGVGMGCMVTSRGDIRVYLEIYTNEDIECTT